MEITLEDLKQADRLDNENVKPYAVGFCWV